MQVTCFLDWLHMAIEYRVDLDTAPTHTVASLLWAICTLHKHGYQNDESPHLLAQLASPMADFLRKCGPQEVCPSPMTGTVMTRALIESCLCITTMALKSEGPVQTSKQSCDNVHGGATAH